MDDGITVPLGGKERRLYFNLRAARRAEEKGLRLRMGHIQEDMLGQPLSALAILLWAALYREPDITIEQIEEWVTHKTLPEVLNAFFGSSVAPAILRAVQFATENQSEGAETQEPPAAPAMAPT